MSPSIPLIEQFSAAMSVSSLRHQVIATNIAARDAQNPQRLRLQFDDAMNRASGTARVVADSSGTPVSLEQDLVSMSSNAARYQALARVLGRYFSIAAIVAASSRG